MTRVRIQQPPHRMSARRVLRLRRARIAQVRFEFDGIGGFLQLLARDLFHLSAALGRDETRDDDVTLIPQHLDLLFLRMD